MTIDEEKKTIAYLLEMKPDATIKDYQHLQKNMRLHAPLKETVVKWNKTYSIKTT